jgi:hypothetical protein
VVDVLGRDEVAVSGAMPPHSQRWRTGQERAHAIGARAHAADAVSPLGRAELSAIDAALAGHGSSRFLQPADGLTADGFITRIPDAAPQGQTLRDRSALFQHPIEVWIDPARWKIDEVVTVKIGINHSSQRHERKFVAIDRMRDQERAARRRLDGPKVIELNNKAIVLE